MQRLAQELFDEFKRVDGICRDMFSSQRGVSEYIEQMEQVFAYGRQRIPSWERDYRSLKRVRWLRNQIAHEMTVADCAVDDVEYLQDFHDRLLCQQDPLAVLRRTRQAARLTTPRPRPTPKSQISYSDQEPTDIGKRLLWGMIVLGVLVILGVLLFSK